MLPLLLAVLGATPSLAQQFEARPGLQALATNATGVFEIGAVGLGQIETVLRALVHNGQILQVHSRHGGQWLAKRSGSVGGKAITPTRLDALAQIAGGLDVDVRCASPDVRASFARAADIVLLADPADCRARANSASTESGQSGSIVAGTTRIACHAGGCRVLHGSGTPPAGFQVRINPGPATWGFEGYGIVAVWTIPDD